jgi:hypothetical protein
MARIPPDKRKLIAALTIFRDVVPTAKAANPENVTLGSLASIIDNLKAKAECGASVETLDDDFASILAEMHKAGVLHAALKALRARLPKTQSPNGTHDPPGDPPQ